MRGGIRKLDAKVEDNKSGCAGPQGQLPITNSQQSCIEMPVRLAVLDPSGEHLFWTDENGARDLLKSGKARLIRRRNKARILQATDKLDDFHGLALRGRGDGFSKTRYSHNHESQDNIEKVWTLKRLPKSTRPIFTAVIDECVRLAPDEWDWMADENGVTKRAA